MNYRVDFYEVSPDTIYKTWFLLKLSRNKFLNRPNFLFCENWKRFDYFFFSRKSDLGLWYFSLGWLQQFARINFGVQFLLRVQSFVNPSIATMILKVTKPDAAYFSPAEVTKSWAIQGLTPGVENTYLKRSVTDSYIHWVNCANREKCIISWLGKLNGCSGIWRLLSHLKISSSFWVYFEGGWFVAGRLDCLSRVMQSTTSGYEKQLGFLLKLFNGLFPPKKKKHTAHCKFERLDTLL